MLIMNNINIVNVYMTKSIMANKDCIFYQEGGQIKSCGFKINNTLLKNTIKHASDLAVPPGLFYQPASEQISPKSTEMSEVFNESTYNKLYNLLGGDNNSKKLTRRQRISKNGKTRRHGKGKISSLLD